MNFGKYIHEIELMEKMQKKALLLGSMLLFYVFAFLDIIIFILVKLIGILINMVMFGCT